MNASSIRQRKLPLDLKLPLVLLTSSGDVRTFDPDGQLSKASDAVLCAVAIDHDGEHRYQKVSAKPQKGQRVEKRCVNDEASLGNTGSICLPKFRLLTNYPRPKVPFKVCLSFACCSSTCFSVTRKLFVVDLLLTANTPPKNCAKCEMRNAMFVFCGW